MWSRGLGKTAEAVVSVLQYLEEGPDPLAWGSFTQVGFVTGINLRYTCRRMAQVMEHLTLVCPYGI